MKHLFLIALLLLASCQKDNNDDPATPNGSGSSSTPTSGAPSLNNPPNGATALWTPITFTWTAVPGATNYHFYLWYYPPSGGSSYIVTTYTPNASYVCSLVFGDTMHGQTLYWHVRTMSGTVFAPTFGPWSETRSFVLN